MKKVLNGFLLMLLVMIGAVLAAPITAKAGGYISDIAVKKGDDGLIALEKSNYQVVAPTLKAGDSYMWIGYKSTSDKAEAITGLTGDSPTSLRGIKSEGKSAIKEIYINASKGKFAKVLPLDNLGSVPVVDGAGEPVVFKTRTGSAYINTISDNLFKPYVSQIYIAKASNKKQAVIRLVKDGCQFFVDKGFDGSDGTCIMIGYKRTADEGKAITDIIALSEDVDQPEGYELADKQTISGKKIYVTKDNKYGNPIMDIDAMKGIGSIDIASDELATMIASRGQNQVAKSFLIADSDYKKMVESKTECIITAIGTDDAGDMGIVYSTSKSGYKEKISNRGKLLTKLLKRDEPKVEETTSAEEENDNEKYDEPQARATEQVEETQQVEETNDVEEVTEAPNEDVEGVGTVINEGTSVSKVEIIVLVLVGIMIPVVTIIIKRKIEGPKKNGK